MKKLTKKQRERIKELKERSEIIDEIVAEKIHKEGEPLPLNLILEARFNTLTIAGIKLEGEIAYLKDKMKEVTEEDELKMIEKQIEIKTIRLTQIKERILETVNIGNMIKDISDLGREFSILPL